ncbi:hypothetical protein CHRYSEOSP005_02480 [Chryseobacterium sp. Alg-005]
MNNAELREQEIVRLKRELSIRYNYLMTVILLIYALIYFFIIKHEVLAYYCLIGAVVMFIHAYVFDTIFPSLLLEKRVRSFLIIAPLYIFFFILYFWKYTIVNLCWLVPIPFGAYIFLGKKEGLIFSIYAMLILVIICFTAIFFPFNFKEIPYEKTRYTDISVIGFNIIIICLFVYYKDKIRELEIITAIEEKEQIILPVKLNDEDRSGAELLFENIEKEMINNKLFINPEFNISILSTILKVSNNYISRAIRLQGYSNFNNYVNSHRISYVKKLIEENDLSRITLMYIYTGAGFTSQSTFNRAFKQFVGMTPSEYIQNINDKLESND